MNVQTFMNPETEELVFDQEKLAEWNKLVQAHGLKGQQTIQTKEKSPIPFLAMNKTLKAAFESLCPRFSNVDAYQFDTIPLEALQAISLAKSEQYFSTIQIRWDDVDPDPVAIGITGHFKVYENGKYHEQEYKTQEEADAAKGTGWNTFYETGSYLIARWGAEAKALSQIIIDAKDRFIRSKTTELKKLIREHQHQLDGIQITADEMFG